MCIRDSAVSVRQPAQQPRRIVRFSGKRPVSRSVSDLDIGRPSELIIEELIPHGVTGPDFRQKVVLIAVRSAGALRGNARQPAVCIIGIIRNAVQRIRDGIEQAFAFRIVDVYKRQAKCFRHIPLFVIR